ncbi:MAG: carboxypeptidase-like regulatory domain-containing protein, partial [Bacteroidota bacterium]
MRKVSTTFLLLFFSTTVLAGNTGKLAGRVIDSATKEPLIGANVVVVGTTLGASADLDGKYAILNVPPGIHTLRASAVGYGPREVQNVRVSIDLTTEINFELGEVAVQAEAVIVTAERPLVQKDLTANTAVINTEDLRALPVTEFSQVLSLQAGFVAGSLRGGRQGEVAYWIDGVPVTDVYDGSQVVEVNKNLIEEVQLVSGAFNAEYGQAMSGIVNIATKEGGRQFTGGIGVYGGDYVSKHTDIFPGVDRVKPTAIRNAEFNLGGP